MGPVCFEVGKTYQCRSLGDWDCIFSFECIARTAKFITLQHHDEVLRVGVREYGGVEMASPFGRYSMSPTISADRHYV